MPITSSPPSLSIQQGNWQQLGADATLVRHAVFVQEQQVPVEEDLDSQDVLCEHFVLLLNNKPVATARLSPQGKLGRLAVLAPLRGRGLGKKLVELIMQHALNAGFTHLVLNAQADKTDFYTHLGFQITGPEFDEVGIAHVPMRLNFAN